VAVAVVAVGAVVEAVVEAVVDLAGVRS